MTITHGPEGLTKDASPVFAWDAADATECRLDTGPWLDCADEFRATDLADGGHIFVVRAKDRSANDIRSFTVDTVAPALTLDATAADVTDTTATVHFTAEDGAETSCGIDSEAAVACGTPFTTPDLKNGTALGERAGGRSGRQPDRRHEAARRQGRGAGDDARRPRGPDQAAHAEVRARRQPRALDVRVQGRRGRLGRVRGGVGDAGARSGQAHALRPRDRRRGQPRRHPGAA